jgi:hypothetical protein
MVIETQLSKIWLNIIEQRTTLSGKPSRHGLQA